MQPEQKAPLASNDSVKAFLSLPWPLLITTLSEVRFVEVNDAFLRATELRRADYGATRQVHIVARRGPGKDGE